MPTAQQLMDNLNGRRTAVPSKPKTPDNEVIKGVFTGKFRGGRYEFSTGNGKVYATNQGNGPIRTGESVQLFRPRNNKLSISFITKQPVE